MKNLKKILSLVLALAMALSLMTFAFAKDTGDFADGDDVTYAEAVDVMATVGVFNGTGDGTNFDPKGTLTREQAAKIITYMIMGQAQADKLVATIAPFADVSADRWSAGAIAYCASEGIMNGTGNGKFNPTGELTGLQFSKMLLVALGYDAEIEEMTGAAWGLATSKLAYAVELDDGMDDINLTVPMTREQAAQMAFTTMQTPLVRYPSKGNTISVNGAVVTFGAQEAEYVTSEIAKEQTISDTTLTNSKYFTIEFAEKYCPKLVLSGDYDAFGRPSYTWTYDKVDIGTYVDFTDLYQEYTTEVTGRDLYDLLGKTIVDDYDFTVVVDGVDTYNKTNGASGISDVFNETYIKRDNKAVLGRTGNGVLTQVFVNGQDKTVRITIINSYLAKATSDYNDKKDTASFDVYDLDGTNVNSTNYYWKSTADKSNDASKLLTVSGEDFDVKEIKEDDIVIVTVADGAIQTFEDIDVVADAKIESFKLNDSLTVGGTKYDYATTARYDFEVLADWTGNNSASNLKEKTYNVYLDQYGYVVGVDLVTGTDNYVFITGVDTKNSNLAAKNYEANAIFLDGTMKTITFDNEKSNIDLTGVDPSRANTWCTYTVNNQDIYTLTLVYDASAENASTASKVGTKVGNTKIKVGQYADTTTTDIDVKNVSLVGSNTGNFSKVYGNDNTVYLNVGVKGIDTTGSSNYNGIIYKVVSTVTGIKNASMDVLSSTDAVAQAVKNSKDTGATTTKLTGKTTQGTFVLYKDNGYVIAAVTVADDSESTKNLVYAHTSGLELESYDETADEWTWTRKVIHNGEEITITEKGDGLSELKEMNRYNWYEVAYNANGNVVDVSHAADTLSDDYDATQEYEATLSHLPTAINTGKDVILFEDSEYNGYEVTCPDNAGKAAHTKDIARGTAHPKLEGSLWYVSNQNTTGVYVDDSVKVVFIQTVDNKVTTSIDSGKSALKYVVDHLNNDGSNYEYETSMIVDKGFAKVVIVRDLIGAGSSGSNLVSGDLIVDLRTPNAVKVEHTGTPPTADDALDAVIAKIKAEGYTITTTSKSGDAYTFKVTKKSNGIDINMPDFVWDSTTGYTAQVNITVNGSPLRIATTVTTTAGIASAAGVTDVGTYVNIYDKSANTTTMTAAGSFTPAEGDTFDFGYYKIDVASTVSESPAAANTSANLTAALKSGEAQMYAKKTDTDVEVTVSSDGAVTAPGITINHATYTVSNNLIASMAASGGTKDVTVTVPASALTGNVTITLTAADYVADVTMKVTYNGTTKNVTVPGTATWADVLEEAGWDDAAGATSGKVRDNNDWTKGEAVNGAIGNDFRSSASGPLKTDLDVTFGCVEMGRGTDAAGFAGTGAVVWTANSTAWSSTSDKQYMVPGETLTVAVDLSKLATKIVVGAGAAPVIGLASTADNATTIAVTVTGLAGQVGAADTTALTGLGHTAGTGNKSVTITGVAVNNQLNAGVITFTITAGSTADSSMALALTNS